jgi:hypothetical protein
MWHIALAALLTLAVLYCGFRLLIIHAEKKFDKENAEVKKNDDELARKYMREYQYDLVGFAQAIVYVNRKNDYVKQYLKDRYIYWLAKILTYTYCPS